MATRTCRCGAATDAYVCVTCARRYVDDLGDVPALVHELRVTLSRQARVSLRVGSKSADIPLPFDWSASITLDTLLLTLAAWAAIVTGEAPSTRFPTTAVDALSTLLGHSDWVRISPFGPQAIDEIGYIVNEARKVIDQPAIKWYAGPCRATSYTYDVEHTGSDTVILSLVREVHCDNALYATPGASTVVCTACRARHDVATRREWLLAEAEDALLPLALIWEALPGLGVPQPSWDTVRKWPQRAGARRLEARGLTLSGVELFRCGDVMHFARQGNRVVRRLHGVQWEPQHRDPANPKYSAVHQRLYARFGQARDHACVDCGEPATEWSYNHHDPDERHDSRGVAYSTKFAYYSPRCSACHATFDAEYRHGSC
jgi:hypothetical protein